MNPATLFRLSLLGTLLLTFAGVVVEILTFSHLPPELQPHTTFGKKEESFSPLDMVIAIIGLLLIPAMIIGFIGLYRWQSWARRLFLIVIAVSYAMTPFLGNYVYSGLTYAIYSLATLLSGFTLALAYFSPVAEKFKRISAPANQPPPLP